MEIGSSSTQIFTITNIDGADLTVDSIWLENETSDSFEIISEVPPPPIIIPIGNTYDVIVEFSPSSLGYHSADLRVRSDAANGDATIPIQGVGVPEEIPPSELMSELINSFNEAVEVGTIIGFGPGGSAGGRLKAFGNMLKASSDLILAVDNESACVQLQDALNRVDGEEPPPDFVAGPNGEDLANGILEVMNTLGCP